MQRVGFLKWILNLGSSSRGQTLESLTRAFFSSLTKSVAVPPAYRSAFEQYAQQQQLHRRYPKDKGETTAELQDIYLADPELPSHSGAITGDVDRSGYRHAVYVEIPAWACRLRLLRDENYTLTDRGRVLLLSGHDPSIKDSLFSPGKNPLLLNAPERYVALFSFLDSDGDFIAVLYRLLLEQSNFSRGDAGEAAVSALEIIRTSRLRNVSSGILQQTRLKIDRVIAAAKSQKSGGLGPKESIATPRTEPLVDCGLLAKPNPTAYEYVFTESGREVLTAMVQAPSMNEFLLNRLSGVLAKSPGIAFDRPEAALAAVEQPYRLLRSGLGYVSLRELAIAAVAESLASASRPSFEISQIEHSLKQAASLKSRHVRLAQGRSAGIPQIRIDERIFG
jgi:hypothetical protein